MKKLICIGLLLCAPLSFADDNKGAQKRKERFEKAKQMATSNIDKRISALQGTKSCISSASDKESLKKCRESARSKAKAMREENKAKREEMKAKWKEMKKKRKEARKNKES